MGRSCLPWQLQAQHPGSSRLVASLHVPTGPQACQIGGSSSSFWRPPNAWAPAMHFSDLRPDTLGAGLSVARPELVGDFALAVEELYGPPPPDDDAAGPSR